MAWLDEEKEVLIERLPQENIDALNVLFQRRQLLSVYTDDKLAQMFANALNVPINTFYGYEGGQVRHYYPNNKHKLGDVFISFQGENDPHPSLFILFQRSGDVFLSLGFRHCSKIDHSFDTLF